MGWEYAITIQSGNCQEIIDTLYNEFLSFSKKYTIVKNTIGFSVNDDNSDYSEIMQITVNKASEHTYNIPNGEEYIYWLFHIGGTEAYELKEFIKDILNKTNYVYIISEL